MTEEEAPPLTANIPEVALEVLRKNARTLLMRAGRVARCQGCQREIWFVEHTNGALTPYTDELMNHFIDCPVRDEFRRRR